MRNKKYFVIVLIIAVVIVLIIAVAGILLTKEANLTSVNPTPLSTPTPAVSEKDPPQIISTKPDPLDDTIIAADQVIEITFNRSLQNAPEFKVRIEPKIDFKVELSMDRKTARVIPVKLYQLGASYTLYINPDTKFDGMGNWGETKTFHFRTIKYRGV